VSSVSRSLLQRQLLLKRVLTNAVPVRLYKLKTRNNKIAQAQVKEEIKRLPKLLVTEEEIRAIQAKEHLTLKEAALLLNVSPPTLRQWVLAGKVESRKVGKKHLFLKKQILV
jgi:excisionase family DNA binding protein